MDVIIILAIAILGIADIWLERTTGRGIIARVDDALTKRAMGRFR